MAKATSSDSAGTSTLADIFSQATALYNSLTQPSAAQQALQTDQPAIRAAQTGLAPAQPLGGSAMKDTTQLLLNRPAANAGASELIDLNRNDNKVGSYINAPPDPMPKSDGHGSSGSLMSMLSTVEGLYSGISGSGGKAGSSGGDDDSTPKSGGKGGDSGSLSEIIKVIGPIIAALF